MSVPEQYELVDARGKVIDAAGGLQGGGEDGDVRDEIVGEDAVQAPADLGCRDGLVVKVCLNNELSFMCSRSELARPPSTWPRRRSRRDLHLHEELGPQSTSRMRTGALREA